MATVAFPSPSPFVASDEAFGRARDSAPVRRRAALIYAVIAAIGLAIAIFADAGWLQALGLGIIAPGAGFLGVGGWAIPAFVLVLVLELAACALWQLTANLALPLAIWIGSAGIAAFAAGPRITSWSPYATIVTTVAFFTLCTILAKRTLAAEAARRDTRAVYLPRALTGLEARAVPAPAPGTRELGEDDLAHLRYAFDRALQPLDAFDGFEKIEQFQTSALRYQINNMLWPLQAMQCHYTPNFHGYLNQAQRNLIDKLTVPIVWKWWRWENLWGNFSFNLDPVAKDNIMLGGFSSTYVALYTANTGDRHYLEPGSLTFTWNDRKAFRHDLGTILAAGRYNHKIAVYGPLYPCEPKLTYSTCNLWGNLAHLTADRILGIDYGQKLLSSLRAGHVGEMMGLDGSPHAGRIEPLGIRMPVYTCNFVSAQWGWMASAFFPDLSKRTWATLREECVQFDADGEITLSTMAYDRVDTGNYKKNESGLYANFLILAREHGDEEVAEAISRKIGPMFGQTKLHGTTSYAQASTSNSGLIVLARLVRNGDIRSMTLEGPPASTFAGPLLAEAAYPDVLVAKAFSADGERLELVLYSGADGGEQSLGLARLSPGREYVVSPSGDRFVADPDGRAKINVRLDGRTALTVAPVA